MKILTLDAKKFSSHGGVRGGGFRGMSNAPQAIALGNDPKCGGLVTFTLRNRRTATCNRCGMYSSADWWERLGLKGLA